MKNPSSGQVLRQIAPLGGVSDNPFVPAHEGEGCELCNAGPELPFSMAYQPIVHVEERTIVAYEALVRGPNGEPAATVLDRVLRDHRYSIDQRCREKAIAMAAQLGLRATTAALCINFYPNAIYEPQRCLQRTLAAATAVGFPLDRIIFEITEVEEVRDHEHLRKIMEEYRSHGLRVAIDDFGAGHSGLNLLSLFQPDVLKLDRVLIENIHERPPSQTIVRSVVQVCRELKIELIAEGIECEPEMRMLLSLGVVMMQGYFFARPGFEALPVWP